MWLWPLVLLMTTVSKAAPADSSTGPAVAEEAKVLWKEGTSAFDQGHFQEAVRYLQRYIDRHPGEPDYLRAHFLIGKAYFELGQSNEAQGPLKDFITSTHENASSVEARILLGKIFLTEKKFHEAELIALEAEEATSHRSLPADLGIQSLVLKSQALQNLGHDSQAEMVSEAAVKQLSEKNSSETRGAVYENQLRIKTTVCEKLPSKEPLTDGQLRAQYDRRGTCLQEALLIFQKVLSSQDAKSIEPASTRMESAFESYSRSCSQPPCPCPARKRHDKKEMKRSRAELTDLLVRECTQKIRQAAELMSSWKSESAIRVQKHLEKLSSRPL